MKKLATYESFFKKIGNMFSPVKREYGYRFAKNNDLDKRISSTNIQDEFKQKEKGVLNSKDKYSDKVGKLVSLVEEYKKKSINEKFKKYLESYLEYLNCLSKICTINEGQKTTIDKNKECLKALKETLNKKLDPIHKEKLERILEKTRYGLWEESYKEKINSLNDDADKLKFIEGWLVQPNLPKDFKSVLEKNRYNLFEKCFNNIINGKSDTEKLNHIEGLLTHVINHGFTRTQIVYTYPLLGQPNLPEDFKDFLEKNRYSLLKENGYDLLKGKINAVQDSEGKLRIIEKFLEDLPEDFKDFLEKMRYNLFEESYNKEIKRKRRKLEFIEGLLNKTTVTPLLGQPNLPKDFKEFLEKNRYSLYKKFYERKMGKLIDNAAKLNFIVGLLGRQNLPKDFKEFLKKEKENCK
jgi:cation transport regulator ChaB